MNEIRHIVYSPSVAGSLNYIIKKKNLYNHQVIPMNDDLSYGPLNDIKKRVEYGLKLIDDIAPDDTELKEYVEASIKTWPIAENFKDSKVIIWHSKNAPEQLVLQLIAKCLQDLELHEISLSACRGTGEFTPEQLGALIGTETKIPDDRKSELITNWDKLCASEENLRIWKNNRVIALDVTYYDDKIIEQCRNEFINAARIVGTVLGESDQMISDTWVNYRLIQLIKNNKLEARGDTKQLRTFEVCLPH